MGLVDEVVADEVVDVVGRCAWIVFVVVENVGPC